MLRGFWLKVHVIHPRGTGNTYVRIVTRLAGDADSHSMNVGPSGPGLVDHRERVIAVNLLRVRQRSFGIAISIRMNPKADALFGSEIFRLDPARKTICSCGLYDGEDAGCLQIRIVFTVERQPQ